MSMHGICKSFNPHKGWGFVTSGDGTDYFLLKKALKGYFVDKGYEMFFNPGKDERGRLVANDIQVKLNEDPSQQIFMGQVKSYNEDSGYGFIECEATQAIHGKDVFVMGKHCVNEVGHVPVGGHCKFHVTIAEKGPMAKDVVFIGWAGHEVDHAIKAKRDEYSQLYQDPLTQVMNMVSQAWGGGGKGKGKDGKGYGKWDDGKGKGKGKFKGSKPGGGGFW
eukprot:gnl/TRDRNA2_/TRDRNA2_163489_c0_seq5.p1 gnl/TRDRNA2_/TRDRNA2_163489_c0~~gnl/TRDRNA2_/TRDRNA2_163489_c0_seq5.p1  ORF type:complete len:220 (+),score=43.98 gnl/TRDRNA2_/TRDRNA2_163489_c0_seq5:102-761(+)